MVLALTFPRELPARQVEQFLGGLAGGSKPSLLRPQHPLVLELRAEARGISHLLAASTPARERTIAEQLRLSVPGVRVERIAETRHEANQQEVSGIARGAHRLARDEKSSDGARKDRAQPAVLASELRLPTFPKLLRCEAALSSAAILSSLSGLRSAESVTLQWIVHPVGVPSVPQDVDAPELKRHRAKRSAPLLAVVGRIAVVAVDRRRALQLRGQLLSGLRSANGAETGIGLRRFPNSVTLKRVESRWAPLIWASTLNTAELAGVLGWPVELVQEVPGLVRGRARQVSPPRGVRRTTLAWQGKRALSLSARDRTHHLHLLGPTGSGKSELLARTALQDIEAGSGVVLVDPKGDVAEDVLARIPASRVDDVVVIEPSKAGRMVGLDVLAGSPALAAEHVIHIFSSLHSRNWGPRSEDLLRNALLSLIGSSTSPLLDVERFLSDQAFRSGVLSRASVSSELARFWRGFDERSAADRAQMVAPLANKLRPLSLSPAVRSLLGSSAPVDLTRTLRDKRIIIVPLGSAALGQGTARLIGSLFVASLWRSIQQRSSWPKDRRPFVSVVIDEWHQLLRLPLDVGDMLAQARGYGVGLSLANQNLAQLGPEVRAGVLANSGSKVVFRLGHDDASVMAREFASVLAASDLLGLDRFEVAAVLHRSGEQRVATGTTRALDSGDARWAERVRRISVERFGSELRAEPEEPSRRIGRQT